MNLKGAIFRNFTNLSEIRKILYPQRNISLIDRKTYLYYT